jgi:hypothetical protein
VELGVGEFEGERLRRLIFEVLRPREREKVAEGRMRVSPNNEQRSTNNDQQHHRHVISNVQVLSPWHWHLVSATTGSVPPCRRIDSMK